MFGGGRAHLRLTDEADLLETGVDIVANPPGKKVMQNIELLSGGEKALTAVSLLFAIFLVKPSPFCVLDEVDAPLDEANVGRFNDMVRAMTDRSQFILITHNRRTMEIADRLCGITMEEAGVSKLVVREPARRPTRSRAACLGPDRIPTQRVIPYRAHRGCAVTWARARKDRARQRRRRRAFVTPPREA